MFVEIKAEKFIKRKEREAHCNFMSRWTWKFHFWLHLVRYNDCDIVWDLRTLESSSVFVLKYEQSFPFQSTINTSFIES